MWEKQYVGMRHLAHCESPHPLFYAVRPTGDHFSVAHPSCHLRICVYGKRFIGEDILAGTLEITLWFVSLIIPKRSVLSPYIFIRWTKHCLCRGRAFFCPQQSWCHTATNCVPRDQCARRLRNQHLRVRNTGSGYFLGQRLNRDLLGVSIYVGTQSRYSNIRFSLLRHPHNYNAFCRNELRRFSIDKWTTGITINSKHRYKHLSLKWEIWFQALSWIFVLTLLSPSHPLFSVIFRKYPRSHSATLSWNHSLSCNIFPTHSRG